MLEELGILSSPGPQGSSRLPLGKSCLRWESCLSNHQGWANGVREGDQAQELEPCYGRWLTLSFSLVRLILVQAPWL